MHYEAKGISAQKVKSLLTLDNIRYIVQGLEVLLQYDFDGDERSKIIELRDQLLAYLDSIFCDPC